MGLVRGSALVILLLLFLPMVLAADGNPNSAQDVFTNPDLPLGVEANNAPKTYTVTSGDINKAVDAMTERFQAYNDENFRAFDERIAIYLRGQSQKLVFILMGINFVTAGLIYYFMIKQIKDTSFQSINQKRRKYSEDKEEMTKQMNEIREYVKKLEEYMRKQYDQSLIPTGGGQEQYGRQSDAMAQAGREARQAEQQPDSGYYDTYQPTAYPGWRWDESTKQWVPE